MKVKVSNSPKPNILDTVKLSKALNLAKKKSKEGQIEEAKHIYRDILEKFPKQLLKHVNNLKQTFRQF